MMKKGCFNMELKNNLSLINYYRSLILKGIVSNTGGAKNRLNQIEKLYYDQIAKNKTK